MAQDRARRRPPMPWSPSGARLAERHGKLKKVGIQETLPSLPGCLPPDIVTDADTRNEGIVQACREGRCTQSAIANHLGLHLATVSGIPGKVPAGPEKEIRVAEVKGGRVTEREARE